MKANSKQTNSSLWFLLSLGVLLLLTSCGGSKAAGDINNFGQLQELINSGEFQIEHEWAVPMGGRNINLIGNTNFIRFQEDSVEVYLPFFGVRHFGGGYGSEGGIRYEGIAADLQIQEHTQQKNIQLSFEGDHQGESLEFIIILFPNGSANTSVNSTQRASISYRGDLRTIEKEQE